jgi:peroxiredoxin
MNDEALTEVAEREWFQHWQRGPTRLRWTSLPPQVGDSAPDFALLDQTGRAVRLSDLWSDRPALLFFWRHFGCGCGVGRAERLANEYPALTKAGAQCVVIGQGEPERATWYSDKFHIPCPVLCDPEERAYRAYGLLEMDPWLLLGKPKPGPEYFREVMQKHRAMGRPVADNPFLLPGEFVVNRAGRLVLAYRYQYCDNYPDPETLIEAIKEAMAEAS